MINTHITDVNKLCRRLIEGTKIRQRKNFSSGTLWESKVGYSRAVRLRDFVYVSGTTATDKSGNIIGLGNPYLQTDVVRTRIYVIDINNWEKVGQAHAEYFKEIRPATTLVEVSHLINPEILVEMEADAILN